MLKPPDIDPAAVRRQFSRRAARFDGADFLYRDIEQRMLDRLQFVRLSPARIVDVGCGLGHGLDSLAARYPQSQLLGIDGAAAMLTHNRFRPAGARLGARLRGLASRLVGQGGTAGSPRGRSQVDLACADAQRLPLAGQSVDLLWSNLVWHWLADPPAAAAEWRRILRPQGLLMFSAFGVDTLRELRGLGAQLPEFPDLHDIGDLLGQSGFADPVMDTERLTIHYSDPHRLLADWHGMGGNAAPGRRRGLATPAQRRRWSDAIATLAGPDGRIHLTVEVVFAHAWRGERRTAGDEYQTISWVPKVRGRADTDPFPE